MAANELYRIRGIIGQYEDPVPYLVAEFQERYPEDPLLQDYLSKHTNIISKETYHELWRIINDYRKKYGLMSYSKNKFEMEREGDDILLYFHQNFKYRWVPGISLEKVKGSNDHLLYKDCLAYILPLDILVNGSLSRDAMKFLGTTKDYPLHLP